VVTSKLASDLSSGSKKPEPVSSVSTSEIYSWASQLAVGAIVVARLLGPFSYGLYTLTVTVPVLLVALADVGMNYALIRLPARLRAEGDHARANRLVKLGFLNDGKRLTLPER
jgi:O-antigen/teichoic acid export membrane protein